MESEISAGIFLCSKIVSLSPSEERQDHLNNTDVPAAL